MLQAINGVFKQAAIHLESDAGNVSVLLCAKQISRAANLQIAHGNFKARSQLRELTHGLKTFFRRFAKNFVGAVHEVRERHTT